ncbi:MAG: MoxR family ATPase [Lentisphaeria bacterium]|jgi:MoxR-like ATPase|nr:MoxR family ATPase [Lentisphaeria bacterium]
MDATAAQSSAAFLGPLREEIARTLVGQKSLVDALLIGLLTRGHVLVEGVPGLAKTLAVKTLARAVGGAFTRVQFTPDMLPADLVGSQVYRPADGSFAVSKGPVFANLVLADEVNRAPAKVQSALLEAMEEHQVTIGGETLPLPSPFMVMATQNPIEHTGTYALPEAQMDRFMLRAVVAYPSRDEERLILERMGHPRAFPPARQVVQLSDILAARESVDRVRLEESVEEYILDLVVATRPGCAGQLSPRQSAFPREAYAGRIELGASPRASLALHLAAKARAFLDGRDYVIPDDVKAVAPAVLGHRLLPTYEAEAEGLDADELVRRLLLDLRTP